MHFVFNKNERHSSWCRLCWKFSAIKLHRKLLYMQTSRQFFITGDEMRNFCFTAHFYFFHNFFVLKIRCRLCDFHLVEKIITLFISTLHDARIMVSAPIHWDSPKFKGEKNEIRTYCQSSTAKTAKIVFAWYMRCFHNIFIWNYIKWMCASLFSLWWTKNAGQRSWCTGKAGQTVCTERHCQYLKCTEIECGFTVTSLKWKWWHRRYYCRSGTRYARSLLLLRLVIIGL